MPLWSVTPFVLLLLAIAFLPLIIPRWWCRNRNKGIIAAFLGLPVVVYLLFHFPAQLAIQLEDYLSFIILLGALYVITGGIHIKGAPVGTPFVNTIFLGIGAVLANFIGTTGASMLLIRPFIRANHQRHAKAHLIVFFIFIVSNCGGLLTPLGDPPLYMGFLKGVPFLWTFKLFPQWLFVNGLLLIIFNFLDQWHFNRQSRQHPEAAEKEMVHPHRFSIEGNRNFLFLGGILAALICSGYFHLPFGVKESFMVLLALFSRSVTKPHIYQENEFTYKPIIEVAVLFAGIFATMVPALILLNTRGAEFGINSAGGFFWASGALSSFLDNTPTYLAFIALACSNFGIDIQMVNYGGLLMSAGPALLIAISCGSVFMGANTYIGNGPNFMVKCLAEEAHVKMPSFFGYMAYALIILIPSFILTTLVFFR